jgi:hypothetical protein
MASRPGLSMVDRTQLLSVGARYFPIWIASPQDRPHRLRNLMLHRTLITVSTRCTVSGRADGQLRREILNRERGESSLVALPSYRGTPVCAQVKSLNLSKVLDGWSSASCAEAVPGARPTPAGGRRTALGSIRFARRLLDLQPG